MPRRRGRLVLLTGLALVGCGPEVPHGGVVKSAADADKPNEEVSSKQRRPPTPLDLIPGDLDVVVRVDLSKVRDSLGGDASELLLARAADVASTAGLVRKALAQAEVVWLGMRMADVEHGDRVMVVRSIKQRGHQEPVVAPDPIAWTKESTAFGDITRYLAKSPPTRDGTERIFTFDDRTAIFVSPVESYSVERVLERGPDADRGQPAAKGLVSIDYRTGKLSAAHENAYPSLAALVAGVVRVRATVDVVADQLELDARIRCKTNTAAAKVSRFLETIVGATARRPRYADLLKELKIERSESVVTIAWPLPRAVVAALLVDSTGPVPPPSPLPVAP
ncbi:MAG TPA: hypothetical protein ENK57_15260, partial [Polyangiaceae bacterium]|nr:hypothetical protein [Polyangiaceae bacterium]